MDIREYIDEHDRSAFAKWFDSLDATAAAKVTTAIYRLEQGHSSNVKNVGDGVLEYKIHFGPGYRVYFGLEGKTAVILLGGGTKKRQHQDVKEAQERWKAHKQTKR